MKGSFRDFSPKERPGPTPATTTPEPPHPSFNPTGNIAVDSLAYIANRALEPIQALPEQKPWEMAMTILNTMVGFLSMDPAVDAFNLGLAAGLNKLATVIPHPAPLPAATLGSLHLGTPHVHSHPPAFPSPLLSFGPVLIGGCASVLINGRPAARAGDLGLAVTCGSLSPAFDIFTGSHKVFIGGSRAARMMDITRHCGAAKTGTFGLSSLAVLGLITSLNAAGANTALAAAMANAQAALDAAKAAAAAALMGKDPGTPPSLGVIMTGSPNVHIGGFPVPAVEDYARAFFQKLTRRPAMALQRVIGNMKRARLRNFLSDAVAHLTGHPVDVANGRVLTSGTDLELPGPIPLRLTRNYSSAWSGRNSVLGWGWSHSLDLALWFEEGKAVYRAEDGREIEFSLDPTERPSWLAGNLQEPHTFWNRFDRLLLRSRGRGLWEVESPDGIVREFSNLDSHGGGPWRVAGQGAPSSGVSRVQRIRNRLGHAIELLYDTRGVLQKVVDSAQRELHFQHDGRGRLVQVLVPDPAEPGASMAQVRYAYDDSGDLVGAADSLAQAMRFAYDNHLLTTETNRNGFAFRFSYDGHDPEARCVRTWGDGGAYERHLIYDPAGRLTESKDAYGRPTVYEMNVDGVVTKVTDPLGGSTTYAFDDCLQKLAETNAEGQVTRFAYDERGNRTAVIDPMGRAVRVRYDELNNPISLVNQTRSEWTWRYDTSGRRTQEIDPQQHVVAYEYDVSSRLLAAIVEPASGRRTDVRYDSHGNPTEIALNGRRKSTRTFDVLGRLSQDINAKGHVRRLTRDRLGRIVEIADSRNIQTFQYDPEGNLLRATDKGGAVAFAYTGFNWLRGRQEPGDVLPAEIRFQHDKEGRLVEVRNENGERYRYVRDAVGNVIEEISFDGLKRRYKRDKSGAIVETRSPSGKTTEIKRDPCGRALSITRPDGAEVFKYREDGALLLAKNQHATVRFERDVFGRVTREMQIVGQEVHAVSSFYKPGATRRHAMKSSLGLSVDFEEDLDGNTASVAIGTNGEQLSTIHFVRDALGLEVERHLPGGVVAHTERDEVGRPLRQWSVHQGELLTDRRYEWTDDERITRIVDKHFGVSEYQHDKRRRLVAATFNGEKQWRTQDAVGNVYKSPDCSDRRYGPGGRLIELHGKRVHHDKDGNVSRKPLARGGEMRFAYHSSGLLKETTLADGRKVSYRYDALGRRTAKASLSEEVQYHWDGDDIVFQTSNGAHQAVVSDPDGLDTLAEVSGHVDLLVADYLGTEMERYSSPEVSPLVSTLDAFGVPRSATTAAWAGQSIDLESDLRYNRFRFYDTDVGSYISPDPPRLSGGLNGYAYVDDPSTSIDPLGLSSCTPTPADMASSWQGKGDYPGRDHWHNVTLRKGTIIWGGEPGRSDFYVTSHWYRKAPKGRVALWGQLQVKADPKYPLRKGMTKWIVTEDTPAAIARVSANPQWGPGGGSQIYVPHSREKDAMTPVITDLLGN